MKYEMQKSIGELLDGQKVKVKKLKTGVTTFIRPNGHVLASDNKILKRCSMPILTK